MNSKWTGSRTQPELIKVIEELGLKASAPGCRIIVVEIPDDVLWGIDDYDNIFDIYIDGKSFNLSRKLTYTEINKIFQEIYNLLYTNKDIRKQKLKKLKL
jgi:hypothetical protein